MYINLKQTSPSPLRSRAKPPPARARTSRRVARVAPRRILNWEKFQIKYKIRVLKGMLTFLFSLLFCARWTGPGAWAWYKRTQFGYKTEDTNKGTQLESLTFTSNDFVPFSVSYIESYSGSVSNLDIWFSLSVQKRRIKLIITREEITKRKWNLSWLFVWWSPP